MQESLHKLLALHHGCIPFDAFMHHALYAPGLGYYAHGSPKLGLMPQSGSDFVTAPVLSPVFGACVGEQVVQALDLSGTDAVYEFGAGNGALALQICELLAQKGRGQTPYFIIEVSSSLRQRQRQALAQLGSRVQWLSALPERMEGVVLGNEVLDAMPVKLLVRQSGVWHERCVVADETGVPSVAAGGEDHLRSPVTGAAANGTYADAYADTDTIRHASASPWAWQDTPTTLRPPVDIPGPHDYLTEIHPQAEAFITTLAEHLHKGMAFFIDYGFPEAEYYHPQRHMGTLMCHYQHQADPDPLDKVGHKDITAHVNFSGIALAGQNAGLDVVGYASQARFLMNCGLLSKMQLLTPIERGHIAKLATEHEMGELFKVLGFAKGLDASKLGDVLGFSSGDRTHTL
jgi:SAM-dependent MidA family methyltransferase